LKLVFKIGYGRERKTSRTGTKSMIVCQCTGATDAAIRDLIRAGAVSVSEIVRRSGCGRCCAPCRNELAAILGQQLTSPGEIVPGRQF
jgi:bacterioferritin-associated ferredoxin